MNIEEKSFSDYFPSMEVLKSCVWYEQNKIHMNCMLSKNFSFKGLMKLKKTFLVNSEFPSEEIYVKNLANEWLIQADGLLQGLPHVCLY